MFYNKGRKEMNDNNERCLCNKCVSDYELAGYTVKRLYKIKNKDQCDKCFVRYGWTYSIKNKRSK